MDVIGFGALNVDKIYKVSRIPKPDEEAFVKDVEVYPGGSAANTIVGLSRLKLKTGYIGKVGNDEDGRFLLEDLRKEGVDTHQVIEAEGRSGNALIFVDEEGNRAILVDPGVNDTITYDEIDLDYVQRFRLLHLTSFVCKLSDESFKAQKRLAEEFDRDLSFDPGTIYAEKGLKELKPILKRTTIFMPNRSEIETLTGLSYREASQHLLDLGVELSLKITPKVIDDTTIYIFENDEIVACMSDDISVKVIDEIKAIAPYQVVLKDSCFKEDKDKINAVESLSKVSTVSVI
jgi:ribokinase